MLELLIAMIFVVMLATGIVMSITTALRVWKLTTEQNDLQQEARTIMDLVTHDLRESYLGVGRTGGFFIGGIPSDQLDTTPTGPTDPLFLTTQSTSGEQTSFLPEEAQQQWDQTVERPISDTIAVNWQWMDATSGAGDQPAGLYRTTEIVQTMNPDNQPLDESGMALGVVTSEFVSDRVKSLRFRYYDGQQWLDSWDSRQQQLHAPQQVSVELELLDPSEPANESGTWVSNTASSGERKHVYRTVVSLPTY